VTIPSGSGISASRSSSAASIICRSREVTLCEPKVRRRGARPIEAKSMRLELSETRVRCLDEMVEAELIIRGVMMTGATANEKLFTVSSHSEGEYAVQSERMRVESVLLWPKGAMIVR
jgi:hypothetical protein